MCEITNKLLPLYYKTRKILVRIKEMQSKENLSEYDFKKIALLRTELMELCPPERYLWNDGYPQIDIVTELIKIETGKEGSISNINERK